MKGKMIFYHLKNFFYLLLITRIFNSPQKTFQLSIFKELSRPLTLTIKHFSILTSQNQLKYQKQKQQSSDNSNILNQKQDDGHFKETIYNRDFLQPNTIQNSNESMLANFKRICYFRMDPKTEIKLNQVDGSICTHLILAFFTIDSKGNLTFGNEETDLNYLDELKQFRAKYPNVKIMISVYNDLKFNSFPKAAIDAEFRQKFARSSIEFLKNYNLDGIDLDWEFPNFPTTFRSREYEKYGLTKIVRSLRSAIVENFYDRQVKELNDLQTTEAFLHNNNLTNSTIINNNINSNNDNNNNISLLEPYLLTVAIAGQESVLRASYELKQLANLCDWLNVMSYDYYLFKPYTPFTGPNSPLNSIVSPQVPILNKLSLSWTLNKLIDEDNIPKNKLVMGIPTYARAYKLMFKNNNPTPFTISIGAKGGQIEDYLNYREVCDILDKSDTIVEFDNKARVPYLLTDNGYTWISYENTQSVREKVRFILENQLAGYMTWNLNSDDFKASKNNCKNGLIKQQMDTHNSNQNEFAETFPLHKAMLEEVNKFDLKISNSKNNKLMNINVG